MSDANLSADKIRSMLAEANERLRKASAEYFDLLEKGLSSSPLPVADQAKQFCGYMQRNVTATFDLGDKLIQAKDMQEAGRVQSEFFQEQMRSLTDHARGMGEFTMKAPRASLPQRAEGNARSAEALDGPCRSQSSKRKQWRFNSWSASSSARSTS